MSGIGSKVIWIAGGTGLFAAAFMGVALARGAALNEVPPFRWFASAPPAGDHAAASESAAQHANATASSDDPKSATNPAASSGAEPPRPAPAVPSMTAGVLGAFVMPSPYDARELHDLDRRLKDGLARVAAEEERLKRRERELDDWQSVLERRAQELGTLRKSADEPGAQGASPGDKNVAAKSAASWRALAPLFEDGDPSEVADRLGQLDPDQAAQVLRGLDSERAAAILNALPKDRYKVFLDAWRRAGG
jgi:flagellar motility protein MotE (MotC chaperone)